MKSIFKVSITLVTGLKRESKSFIRVTEFNVKKETDNNFILDSGKKVKKDSFNMPLTDFHSDTELIKYHVWCTDKEAIGAARNIITEKIGEVIKEMNNNIIVLELMHNELFDENSNVNKNVIYDKGTGYE
jgi:hypothetical protein